MGRVELVKWNRVDEVIIISTCQYSVLIKTSFNKAQSYVTSFPVNDLSLGNSARFLMRECGWFISKLTIIKTPHIYTI